MEELLTKDIQTEVSVIGKKESIKETRFTVRCSNELTSEVEIEVNIPEGALDAETHIEVPPHNWAYGTYNLMEPPKTTVAINAVKDAFGRGEPGFNRLNYGATASVQVKKVGTNQCDGYYAFDISSLDPKMAYVNTYIELSYQGVLDPNFKPEVYAVDKDWNEFGLTWENRELGAPIEINGIEVDASSNKIRIDISSYMKRWVTGIYKHEGFRLFVPEDAVDTGAILFARETPQIERRPLLITTFLDPNVKNTGRKNTAVEVSVIQNGRSSKETWIEPTATFTWLEGEATLYVHRWEVPLERDTEAEVTVSKPFTGSVLTVRRSEVSITDAEVTPKLSQISETEASVTATRPEAGAEIYVFHKSTRGLEVIPRVKGQSNTLMSFAIKRDETPIELIAQQDTALLSVMDALGKKQAVLSEVLVSNNKVLTEVSARRSKYIDGDVVFNVDPMAKSTMGLEFNTSKPYVGAEVTPRLFADNSTEISVLVTKPFTGVEVSVLRDTTEAEVVARLSRHSSITSEISINRQSTDVYVAVPYDVTSDVDTEVLPRILKASDLLTEFIVAQKKDFDETLMITASRDTILTEVSPRVYAMNETEVWIKPGVIIDALSDTLVEIDVCANAESIKETTFAITRDEVITELYVKAIGRSDVQTVIEVPLYAAYAFIL